MEGLLTDGCYVEVLFIARAFSLLLIFLQLLKIVSPAKIINGIIAIVCFNSHGFESTIIETNTDTIITV